MVNSDLIRQRKELILTTIF